MECTSPQGASPALGTPLVRDVCDPSPAVANDAPGSFPLGPTSVTWNARDASGNTGTAAQTVQVVDSTPPSIQCPAPQTKECTGSQHATATYSATASDVCWGTLSPACNPPSGTSFGLGRTAVTCDVTDGSGNHSRCGTQVTVVDTTPRS